MKTELIKLIKKNYKDLAAEQVDELAEKIYGLLPTKKYKLCDIKAGETFKFAGYDFVKLANEEESCYCLLNDSVFESKFGETNDWSKSSIRKRLNEFDDNGNSIAVKGINKKDLVAASLNYTAYKMLNGRSTDYITCLSYEEYWAYGFPTINKDTWLRSGDIGCAGYTRYLTAGETMTYTYSCLTQAVRPALHFRKDLEIEL